MSIEQGFGAKVIAYDLYENEELKKLGVTYVSKEELLQRADVLSLHCPLLPSTYHMIDKARWVLSYCAPELADRPSNILCTEALLCPSADPVDNMRRAFSLPSYRPVMYLIPGGLRARAAST